MIFHRRSRTIDVELFDVNSRPYPHGIEQCTWGFKDTFVIPGGSVVSPGNWVSRDGFQITDAYLKEEYRPALQPEPVATEDILVALDHLEEHGTLPAGMAHVLPVLRDSLAELAQFREFMGGTFAEVTASTLSGAIDATVGTLGTAADIAAALYYTDAVESFPRPRDC
jgi:hypothetical protein